MIGPLRIKIFTGYLAWLFLCVPLLFGAQENVGTTAMDFSKLSTSVKSDAVGNALTAGMDLSALSLNPASIASERQVEIYFQHLGYIQDITFQTLSVAVPTPLGVFGFDAGLIDTGTQIRTTVQDKSGTGDTFSNQAYQAGIAYANKIGEVSLGAAGRYYVQYLDSQKGTTVGLDLGINYQPNSAFSLGAAVNNITLQKAKYVAVEAGLPQTYRLGVQYHSEWFKNPLTLSAHVVSPQDDVLYVGVGIDYVVYQMLALRGGYNSYSDLSTLSIGLGLLLEGASIDFAYKPTKDFGQSYRMGIGIKLK